VAKIAVGVGLDLLAILIFVAIGRSVHQHGESISGLASTTWPFGVGLAMAWVTALAVHRTPSRPRVGVGITGVTVTVGMVLRVLAGQGTAFAFVVVALVFLGAEMALWRVAGTVINRSGRTQPEQ
jgi:hypothetical protein